MAPAAITNPRTLLPAAAATFLALLAAILLFSPLRSLEERVTALRYAVRGDRVPDSNIVVVYIDDAAIKVVGWPVRRNFHALMVKALTDLKVRAMGIELVLEDQRVEYPEYDDLLAGMMASSRPVALTCYFDSLSGRAATGGTGGEGHPAFHFPAVMDPAVIGFGLHMPLGQFATAAAGIGHVNLSADGSIPVFIGRGRESIPSFGLEVTRLFLGVERAGVQSDGGSVMMRHRADQVAFGTTAGGEVALNYSGPLATYTVYPFLDVLRAYDQLRSGGTARVPVLQLQDKIVLIGVVAEGRGVVFTTPVDPRMPSIGLHAAFLDNALHAGFQTTASPAVSLLFALLVSVLCLMAVLGVPGPWGKVLAGTIVTCAIALSFFFFAVSAVVLPVLPMLLVAGVATLAGILARHRIVRGQVDQLTAEKDAVLSRLHDKEAQLAVLERQFLDDQAAQNRDRTEELLEEIRRHKAEIRSLSERADDMVEATPGTGEDASAVFEGIVYSKNGAMRPAIEFVAKIAGSDAPVLILGESGTGKELIAQAIHKRSTRSGGSFIAVNCGALAENLLESELFGHEKGSFTGAVKDKMGRFELADGGTIFLDEIGEVSDGFQLKLLRVLQEGEFERVGGTKTVHVDVRVLAATNKDLRIQVKAQRFREDLYYRLNVLTVSLPPLRERKEDTPLLVNHFLRREGEALRVSRNVMDALQEYGWPGNVRELESVIRRGSVLAEAEHRVLLTLSDLTVEVAEAVQGKVPLEEQILEMVREFGFSRSSVSQTAAALGGLNRGTVAEYLRGEFLKAFVEHRFDLQQTILVLSLSSDALVNGRVRRRLQEYLGNIADGIDRSQPWEMAREALKPKTKNLPQRYHSWLEQVAEASYRNIWSLPDSA